MVCLEKCRAISSKYLDRKVKTNSCTGRVLQFFHLLMVQCECLKVSQRMQAPDLGSVQCCCSRTLLLGLCLSSTARYLRPDHFKNWATLTCVSCILSQDACVRTEAKSAYCPLGMQRSAAVNKKQLRWRLLLNRNSLRYLIHGFIVSTMLPQNGISDFS